VYRGPGVYRGPPEVYRGPCMKNMRWNQGITYTVGSDPRVKNPDLVPSLMDILKSRPIEGIRDL